MSDLLAVFLLVCSWLFHGLHLWARSGWDEYWNHSQSALQGLSVIFIWITRL